MGTYETQSLDGGGGGAGVTAGTGLTLTGGVLSNDLLTGKAGGQTITGGTATGESLTIRSTSHATKGFINFGTGLTYDETNKRLGFNNAAPECVFHSGAATVGALALLGAASMGTVISLQSGSGTYPGIFFGSAAASRGALYFGDGTGIVLSTNVGTLDLAGISLTTVSATAVQIKSGSTVLIYATALGVHGSNAASGNLLLGSTGNATKGMVNLGYDGSSVVVGAAAILTTATDGFLYIPGGAGAPTGVPTSRAGRYPLYWNTTQKKLHIYDGAWLGATAPGVWS